MGSSINETPKGTLYSMLSSLLAYIGLWLVQNQQVIDSVYQPKTDVGQCFCSRYKIVTTRRSWTGVARSRSRYRRREMNGRPPTETRLAVSALLFSLDNTSSVVGAERKQLTSCDARHWSDGRSTTDATGLGLVHRRVRITKIVILRPLSIRDSRYAREMRIGRFRSKLALSLIVRSISVLSCA